MISALLPNYARLDLAFERGEGAWLWTVDGRRFLDFGSGIATASVGHGNPHLVKVIAEQAAKVIHTSNLYRIPQAERLAQRLVDATFADSVFFCNSGAEANEGMIKMMRRAMSDAGKPERFRFICFEGAFHGRTLATLAATGNAQYLEGFGPVVEGFDHVPFNNMNAVRAAIGPATCGIIVEPIQGEGGVRPADPQFLRDLRAVCDEYGIILGMDEVQSGMGRTGKLFAHEWAGITPDVMSAAKGIGGGFPLGAVLAKEEFAKALKPGTHGTTYGGNPLAMAVGLASLEELTRPETLANVRDITGYFAQQLSGLKDRFPEVIEDIRGKGLLIGLKLKTSNRDFMALARDQKLLIAGGGDNCVRLLPSLLLTREEAREAVEKLERACEVAKTTAAAA